MDPADSYISRLIFEKAHAQQLAAAWCGLAGGLALLLDQRGVSAGLPPLRPDLDLPALQAIAATLTAHLDPPGSQNGTVVAAGVGG